MVTLPILTRLVVSDYSLFPGTEDRHGIDRPFAPGLALIAGIGTSAET